MKVNVLVINKDGQENHELSGELGKWKELIETKHSRYNFDLHIQVLDDLTDLELVITRGELRDYQIIFTPFAEGEPLFDLMEKYLTNTVILRVKDYLVEAYTSTYRNGNYYPKFGISILQTTTSFILAHVDKVGRQPFVPQTSTLPLTAETQQEGDIPSPSFVQALMNGNGFAYTEGEDTDEEEAYPPLEVEDEDDEVESESENVELYLQHSDQNEVNPVHQSTDNESNVFNSYVPLIDSPSEEKEVIAEVIAKNKEFIHQQSADNNVIYEDDEDNELLESNSLEQTNFLVDSAMGKGDYERLHKEMKGAENEPLQEASANDDSLTYIRTKTIQKQLFAKQKWENHKTIGIWSPLHRKGVTTFAMNYALFLGENRVYTSLLEGLRGYPTMKYWLDRYSSVPKHWQSYSKTIHSDIEPNVANWTYRNVLFLPIDLGDGTLPWNTDKLKVYMSASNIMDITLVDLPTGEMATSTIDSLIYLDELWILVDDTYQEFLAWKEYMHLLKDKTKVDIKLIFNQSYEFSQVKRLSKALEIDVIATLPSLHEEVMKNYYATEPIYAVPEVREKVNEGFLKITKHLIGEDFRLAKDRLYTEDKSSLWLNWSEKFRRWLKV
ncbi:hypothetical protein LG296_19740 (plasmid) [Ureibacillus chungkukjangi]|uniref:hypothetical protein n=1 Tax=Ureibacillus chungkukjangi TaxID=1202712 RepID=UPI000D383352|nr:hypothetical protein [Ureibacillus chungkukjangi]MCM3390536.1 hypothetical protein [Ureibacillus chungkukjangi]